MLYIWGVCCKEGWYDDGVCWSCVKWLKDCEREWESEYERVWVSEGGPGEVAGVGRSDLIIQIAGGTLQ